MAQFEDDQKGTKVQWSRVDIESTTRPRPTLHRTDSNFSIHSVRSTGRRASIDPSSTLPIAYRTISYQIAESKEKHAAELQVAKGSVAKDLINVEWHTLFLNDVYSRLSSSPTQGLSSDQVTRRLADHGRNILSPPPTHYFQMILGYLFKGFGSVLLLGSILVFIAWKPLGDPPLTANLALAIVLLAVFIIQAAFNAWQDWSSSRVMASIKNMLPDDCQVLRNGSRMTITAIDIVPGDILYIKAGSKLCADIRFVEVSSDIKLDRSILTGESVPISGTVESTDDNYLETKCIGLQGTHCIAGSAIGIVVSTGDSTVFGKIAKLTTAPKNTLTPLEREILNFVTIICSIMLAMILLAIIVWAAYLRPKHHDWINTALLIVDCVSIAVAFIPEGLPIAVTASLTIIARLMHKNKILCKSLKTVETLGAVSVICSDKTGTLTQNAMHATHCSIGMQGMSSEDAHREYGTNQESKEVNSLIQLHSIAGLCNSGDFDAATATLPLSKRIIFGDATDQAILRFSEAIGPVSELRRQWKKTFELAFNSKNKYMITTYKAVGKEGPEGILPSSEAASFHTDDTLLTIKGAPDILINQCSTYLTPQGQCTALDDIAKVNIEVLKDAWSSEGKRVILLARKVIPKERLTDPKSSASFEDEVIRLAGSDLTLVGLIGMVDPPRPEIPSVMSTLRSAGIRVFMVTGDFALTAQAIAIECGLITNPPNMIDKVEALQRNDDTAGLSMSSPETKHPDEWSDSRSSIVLSGPELIHLNDYQWDQLCKYDEIVFARTTPQQKLRIVRAFQERSEIVGMTGDGVNDAPSLKAADIGIAIGSGSDIAMEAADMVLLDSFSAIVEAVRYGRVVFDNLKKTIAYLLPAGSFSEFWPVMTNVIFGLPQVLSSFLMIIICCFTDCAAAITLAYESPEADVLLRKPRKPKVDRLVNWQLMFQAYGFIGVIETVTSFAMSYWYLQRNGISFSDLWFKYGALPEDLDQDYVNGKLNEASSIYFINLVVMQWFNLMAVRTRRLSIFQHPPIFNKATQNLYLFPAILFAFVMAMFWLYIPAFQNSLNTTRVPVEHFFLPVAFGIGILFVDELRKWAVRKWPQGVLAEMAW